MLCVSGKKGRDNDLIKQEKRKCNTCKELQTYNSDSGHTCTALGCGREGDYFDSTNKRNVRGTGTVGWEIWLHTRVPSQEEAGIIAYLLCALTIGSIRQKYN